MKEEREALQKYIFIALGGALGSLARFGVGSMVAGRMGTRFPYGTFIINISACIIIGFSIVFLDRHVTWNPAWRFLVPVGFVGAYSTFPPSNGKPSPICRQEHSSLPLSMSP